ncbi:PIG-L deacetylase family protein [Enterovirga rhinocerotis]|uniref:LmbE family N-acetylglucosaminyl deacetylase n=1 Tax=Enterovirga rhinocerotis TaxID=1339210 RepID=A0A4R7BJ73_9HYPH|nr:PIG-L deacetylase family protein [Enterovirga rhinocerotis]TDR85298.1 LmbE family N-acetylglucosaminyl deacetylase [Enterovirga rhinocerotis]
MRADAFLAAAEALPFGEFDAIARGRGLVVLAPHPDDESLGCGGLIAEACARGASVRVVVLSDGTGSHPNSPSHPPDCLRTVRERETVEAARALGLEAEHVRFLRLADRFVPSDGTEAAIAADRIADMARECEAGTILATWRHDPHCDHAATAAIARLVCRRLPTIRLLAYPVWGWALPPATEVGRAPRGLRLDISRHAEAKRSAVAAHRSQTSGLIADDPAGFRLDEAMLAQFSRTFEIYLEVEE